MTNLPIDPPPAPKKFGIHVVPPPTGASPSHLPATDITGGASLLASMLPAGDVPFWRPGILALAAALGWRWIFMGPALLFTIAPIIAFAEAPGGRVGMMWLFTFKLWIFAISVVISLSIWALRNAVRQRKGVFCIHCGYDLSGSLAKGACPECGRPYIVGICDEYKKDPAFFRTRFAAIRSLPKNKPFGTGA
ncbi:MAG: hypothetical protein WC718_13325 [Phycisphaerales bacterium]|jgi:hypothetical protein